MELNNDCCKAKGHYSDIFPSVLVGEKTVLM